MPADKCGFNDLKPARLFLGRQCHRLEAEVAAGKCRDHFLQANSQGTSLVLYGVDLNPELSGLFPEPVLSALYGFFVAAVKDTLVVGLSSRSSSGEPPNSAIFSGAAKEV